MSPTSADDELAVALHSAVLEQAAALPSVPPAEAATIPSYGLHRPPSDAPLGEDRDELANPNSDEDPEGLDEPLSDETLADIDLVAETLRLFRQTRRLLSKVLLDKTTPVNQKAAVVTSLSSLLRSLASQQTDLYNAERLKRLETVLIEMVRTLPEVQQDAFMTQYETIVANV